MNKSLALVLLGVLLVASVDAKHHSCVKSKLSQQDQQPSLGPKYAVMDTAYDLAAFISGLTKGLINEDVGGEIVTCVGDGSQMFQQVEAVISDFIQGNIWYGIYETAQIIVEIPVVYKDCTAMAAAIPAFEQFGARFADFDKLKEAFTINIFYHGVEIYGHINDSLQSLNAGEWFEVGRHIGTAVELATRI